MSKEISFVRGYVNNVKHPEENACRSCIYFEAGDSSVGLADICDHPVFFDEDGDLIDDLEKSMDEVLMQSDHCILRVVKAVKKC